MGSGSIHLLMPATGLETHSAHAENISCMAVNEVLHNVEDAAEDVAECTEAGSKHHLPDDSCRL